MKISMTALALAAALASAAGAAMAQGGPMRGPMGPMGGPMFGELDFTAIDTDNNGSLSRAELQARAVARLSLADTNRDGALDREELVAALSDGKGRLVALFTVDPAEEMADRLLALMGGTRGRQGRGRGLRRRAGEPAPRLRRHRPRRGDLEGRG